MQLGKILSDHKILGDSENMFISEIMGNDELTLALIADVLTSTNFSLSTYKENDTDAAINIPVIQEYISDLSLDFSVEKTAENEVKFKGKDDLTFAFSCVEIKIDPNTGQFSRGDWLQNIRSAKGDVEEDISDRDWNKFSKFLIDENQANPLLIDL